MQQRCTIESCVEGQYVAQGHSRESKPIHFNITGMVTCMPRPKQYSPGPPPTTWLSIAVRLKISNLVQIIKSLKAQKQCQSDDSL